MSNTILRILRLAALATGLLAASAVTAYAQKAVHGRVVEAGTGYGAIGAAVVVDGSSTGAITDVDGNFELAAPEGSPVTVPILGPTARFTAVWSCPEQGRPA